MNLTIYGFGLPATIYGHGLEVAARAMPVQIMGLRMSLHRQIFQVDDIGTPSRLSLQMGQFSCWEGILWEVRCLVLDSGLANLFSIAADADLEFNDLWQLQANIQTCSTGSVLRNNECLVCSDGWFSLNNNCTGCQTGLYCTNGLLLTCPANSRTKQALSTTINQCICDVGFYGRGNCEPCPSGATCNTTNFVCKAGFGIDSLEKSCVMCGGSSYKPLASNTPCSPCPYGAFCTATSFVCDVGFTLNEMKNACNLCKLNSFKPFASNESCIDCPPGAVCDVRSILMCPEGYSVKSDGTECVLPVKIKQEVDSMADSNSAVIIASVISVTVLFLAMIVAAFVIRKRHQHQRGPALPPKTKILNSPALNFDFSNGNSIPLTMDQNRLSVVTLAPDFETYATTLSGTRLENHSTSCLFTYPLFSFGHSTIYCHGKR